MRKLAIALGCAAVMLASQANAANAYGTVTFRFLKSGATPATFQDDREACHAASQTMTLTNRIGVFSGFYYDFDWRKFLHCMADKGYRPAENGDLVARMPFWA